MIIWSALNELVMVMGSAMNELVIWSAMNELVTDYVE